MDYNRVYAQLIENAKDRTLDCYTEKHHIIPKSKGGSNKKENFVRLTGREHYIAHKLLWKIYRDRSSVYAWHMMTINSKDNKGRSHKVSSRQYQYLKEQFSKAQSGENHPMYGKKHTEETLKLLSESRKGKSFHTKEQLESISKIWKGKKLPEYVKKKSSKTRRENPTEWTEEKRANLRAGHANNLAVIVSCPHCGLTKPKSSNMKRYHFDNCKSKRI